MQVKSKLINSNESWNVKRRYKINAVVTHNSSIWQNSTGINSEPNTTSDWVLLNTASVPELGEQIEFTSTGGETTYDIGTNALVKSWFWDGSPQAKSQWSQTGSVLTFAFPLSTGSFNIFI